MPKPILVVELEDRDEKQKRTDSERIAESLKDITKDEYHIAIVFHPEVKKANLYCCNDNTGKSDEIIAKALESITQ